MDSVYLYPIKVVDNKNVEYNGKTMSLTALAKLLPGKKYAVADLRFFKYKSEEAQ
ncbi:hypothetical protein [uncultured Ruminococcus sp.]|uniref:hypothetical protein n=1 Tax=uncultured Ruminococcus sp. TaxID=165186 RepID=UPI002930A6C1|nr:hypothetical protein [uncultured Ruminococcus sp.]